MNKTIFVNENKVATDFANVQIAKGSIEMAARVLVECNISPKHAIEVLSGSYGNIQNEYVGVESAKLDKAAEILGGANALLDVAHEKIKTDAAKIINDLKVKIRPLEWQMNKYFVYFEFADGAWSLKKDYQKQIEKISSIILTDEAEIERYEKHVKLVELLNELSGEGINLQILINKMVKFDNMTGKFSMKYKIFDTKNILPSYY